MMLERPRQRAFRQTRQARFRERRRLGIACATVPYDADTVGLLVRLGWLADADTHGQDEIGEAIGAMLREAARS